MYKLTSGCIAERIKPCLDSIIHSDQKGFIYGRYIGECIRTTFDIIEYAKTHNRTGILLCIDFEKAYDSISFAYIKKCLKFFNFGESLIKWVDIILNNFTACINHCGNISQTFNIKRGCRQGDPIAAYLFILSIEIMAIRMRQDPNLRPFGIDNEGDGEYERDNENVGNNENGRQDERGASLQQLLELYADDCSIFLHPTENNLRLALNILQSFYSMSGLKINLSKTSAIWFGVGHNNRQQLCPEFNLEWTTTFKLLGITFDNNLTNMETNFTEKVNEIEKLLNRWYLRYLTPYGKITVIKTLALSKLSHVALVIPSLSSAKIKNLEKNAYLSHKQKQTKQKSTAILATNSKK